MFKEDLFININQILNNLTEEEIKFYKDNAIEMQTIAGQNLEEAEAKTQIEQWKKEAEEKLTKKLTRNS